jgi:DNA repair exonuclease SbcCD nuclease subunit
MKICICSDLHIHEHAEFSVPDKDGLSSRLHHTLHVLRAILKYCRAHDVRHMLMGGDLFHRRAVIGTPAWNLVCRVLAAMKRHDISVWMVDGNHDQANRTGSIHALQALASAGLAWIPHDGAGGALLRHEGDAVVLAGVSYCDDRELFVRRLDRAVGLALGFSRLTPTIALLHHGFAGARVGTSLEYQVREELSGAVVADRGFTRVWSGHYHARQRIEGVKRGEYIGSPLEFVRGESTVMRKGFLVYDAAADEVTLVPLKLPRFVQLSQEQINAEDYGAVRGNFVDVVYQELPRAWPEFAAYLQDELDAAGVKPVPVKAASESRAPRLAVDAGMSDRKLLMRYLNHEKQQIRGLDRQELLRLGLELLREADE